MREEGEAGWALGELGAFGSGLAPAGALKGEVSMWRKLRLVGLSGPRVKSETEVMDLRRSCGKLASGPSKGPGKHLALGCGEQETDGMTSALVSSDSLSSGSEDSSWVSGVGGMMDPPPASFSLWKRWNWAAQLGAGRSTWNAVAEVREGALWGWRWNAGSER